MTEERGLEKERRKQAERCFGASTFGDNGGCLLLLIIWSAGIVRAPTREERANSEVWRYTKVFFRRMFTA